MGLALARDVPPGTSLAGLCRSIHVIIRHRIYELEYLVRGQDGVAGSFPVGLLHPLQHAGCSENIIRSKEHLREIRRLAPLRQGVSGIAGDDARGVDVGAFAAAYQRHGTEQYS
jgi:hypothetical protein